MRLKAERRRSNSGAFNFCAYLKGDKLKQQNNCPNCGAAITEEKCPYCGVLFYDFAAMELDKPFYIKFRSGPKVYRAKVLLNSLNLHHDTDEACFYVDDVHYLMNTPIRSPSIDHLTLELTIVPDDGVLSIIVDTDEVSPDAHPW